MNVISLLQYCYSLSAMLLLVCAESVTDKCIFVEAFQLQCQYSPPVKMEVQKLLGNGSIASFVTSLVTDNINCFIRFIVATVEYTQLNGS